MFIPGIFFGLAIILVIIAQRAFFIVQESESAILTSFGRPVADKDGPRHYGPGLHLKAFWHQVHRAPIGELLAPVSYDDTRAVLAHDGTPLKMEATVRYHVSPGQLERYLFGVDHAQEHFVELFECIVRGTVASFSPSEQDPTAYARLRRDRRDFAMELKWACQRTLSDAYGIAFNAVDISSLSPPRELEEALNTVLHADAMARTQLAHATAACEQRTVAANEGVRVAAHKARALHDEMITLAEVLRELKAEGTLRDYIDHRKSEILNQSKTVFVRSNS